MTKNSFFAATVIIATFLLTGCAGKKQLTGIAPSPTSASTAEIAAKPSQTDKNGKGVSGTHLSESSIAADDAARTGANIEHTLSGKEMEPVYFAFDAYLLSSEARNALTSNAALLDENKLVQVIIEGHADERGSDDYNLALAEKRALSAKRYLESLGIDAERMKIISYGEDKPAVAGKDEAAWSKNRRVDFVGAK